MSLYLIHTLSQFTRAACILNPLRADAPRLCEVRGMSSGRGGVPTRPGVSAVCFWLLGFVKVAQLLSHECVALGLSLGSDKGQGLACFALSARRSHQDIAEHTFSLPSVGLESSHFYALLRRIRFTLGQFMAPAFFSFLPSLS